MRAQASRHTNRRTGKTRAHQTGGTLLETMLTTAVMATFLSVAIPNVQAFAHSSRATAVTNELLGSLHLARSEALSRGRRVAVSPAQGTDWSTGWRIYADTDGDGRFEAGRDELIRLVVPEPGVEIVPRFGSGVDGSVLSYGADGLLRRPGSQGLVLGRMSIRVGGEQRSLCVASVRIRAVRGDSCA